MLLEWNRLRGVSDVDLQALVTCRDRQPLITELADDIERLSRRLLECEPQLVRRDRALDLGADMRRRLEESIRRHQAIERLMRALKVVVADEVLEPLLRVDNVREHRATEKLVPQRLPEALDLAQRLRMLRPAADVLDALPRQRFFELGLAAPHRVLAPVIGQHFRRRSVRSDTPLERLHYQRRLLVVRERMTDHESTVVIHEHADVKPLGAAQPEREDVRLPQLVRRRAFETTRSMLALARRLRCLDEPLLVQDLADDLLRHAKSLEALQHVADPPRPPVLVFTLQCHHAFALDRPRWRRLALLTSLRWLQPRTPARTKLCQPLRHRGTRDTECSGHVFLRCPT